MTIKKTILTTILLILCGVIFAQNTADYVVGYYVKAYIEKKTDDNWLRNAFKAEWDKLNNNSTRNPISQKDLAKIINRLPTELNKEDVQQKTKDFYSAIKGKYEENDIEKLIDLPDKYKKWQTYKYNDLSAKLKIELQNQVQSEELSDKTEKTNVKENEKVNSSANGYLGRGEHDQPTKKGNDETTVYRHRDKNNKSSSLWWFWLLLGLGGGTFCWEKCVRAKVLLLFAKKQTPIEKSYQEAELKDDKKKQRKEIDQLKNQIQKLERQNKEFLEENIAMGQKIEGYKYKPKQSFITDVQKTSETNLKVIQATINVSTLYADSIIDGFFNRIVEKPNEDTVYEIVKTSNNKGTFSIYTDAYKRIIKNPDFADGCDKQRINPTPQTLEIEDGETSQDSFGKWQVSKKAKIKFI